MTDLEFSVQFFADCLAAIKRGDMSEGELVDIQDLLGLDKYKKLRNGKKSAACFIDYAGFIYSHICSLRPIYMVAMDLILKELDRLRNENARLRIFKKLKGK